jgi:hypothetical protein
LWAFRQDQAYFFFAICLRLLVGSVFLAGLALILDGSSSTTSVLIMSLLSILRLSTHGKTHLFPRNQPPMDSFMLSDFLCKMLYRKSL